MKTLLALCLAALGCAVAIPAHAGRVSPGWPEMTTPYYHPATQWQQTQRVSAWIATPGHVHAKVLDTGSMRPYLHGGEVLLCTVPTKDTVFAVGQLVGFNRDAKATNCLHMIAAVWKDWIYLSGLNNKHSDGWFHRSKVHLLVHEIVTQPINDRVRHAPIPVELEQVGK